MPSTDDWDDLTRQRGTAIMTGLSQAIINCEGEELRAGWAHSLKEFRGTGESRMWYSGRTVSISTPRLPKP